MLPAVDDTLLPESAAARSENTWLYSGALQGMATPTLLRNLANTTTKVYRIPYGGISDSEHLIDGTWMEFADINTDVLRSQVVGETYDRYYWAATSAPPKYNTKARIDAASPPFLLGIPAPSAAPVVTPAGGSSSINRTNAYVYTWVSAYGEEGPPSPATVVTGKIDDTFAITLGAAGAGDLGTDRNLTLVRIYRTVTGSNGVATFFLVHEQAIATLTYNDTLTDSVITSNVLLPSAFWTGPPSDLAGWVAMPNGIFAGWRNNEIWFSEPYRAHAWPAVYALVVDFPIVGLGVIGQTLIVLTQAYPFAITGIHPAVMKQSKIMSLEPCMSRGSILSTPEGVYYASTNGLILVTHGTANNLTEKFVTKDQWNKVVGVSTLATLRAARLAGAYYAFGSARPNVFQSDWVQADMVQQTDYVGSYHGLFIDPRSERVALTVLSNATPCVNTQNDPWSGELLIIRNSQLFWVNIGAVTPIWEHFLWRSKVYTSSEGKSFSAMKVLFDTSTTTPDQNPVRNTDDGQTLAPDQYGLVRVYAGESEASLTLLTTREIRKSGELMRIPGGQIHTYWQFEIEGRVKIKNFQIATSARELANV
jgi:hypothetical protein